MHLVAIHALCAAVDAALDAAARRRRPCGALSGALRNRRRRAGAHRMNRTHLVVVGDALLDRDVDGTRERLCPDAPVPVVDVRRMLETAGGAGLAALLCAERPPGDPRRADRRRPGRSAARASCWRAGQRAGVRARRPDATQDPDPQRRATAAAAGRRRSGHTHARCRRPLGLRSTPPTPSWSPTTGRAHPRHPPAIGDAPRPPDVPRSCGTRTRAAPRRSPGARW